jgi:ATP-dependent Lhr-like helicase
MKGVLASSHVSPRWSQRAQQQIESIRARFAWIDPDKTAVARDKTGNTRWWTFAGYRANLSLAEALSKRACPGIRSDNFGLTFETGSRLDSIESAIAALPTADADSFRPVVDERAIEGLKFSACLPRPLALEMLERRLADVEGVKAVLGQRVKWVIGSG